MSLEDGGGFLTKTKTISSKFYFFGKLDSSTLVKETNFRSQIPPFIFVLLFQLNFQKVKVVFKRLKKRYFYKGLNLA